MALACQPLAIDAPTARQRAAWAALVDTPDAHAGIAAGLPCLTQVECVPPPDPAREAGWLRVVAWNVERLRDPSSISAVMARTGAAVALLTEVDDGMARTGNRNGAAAVAGALAMGYAYGVEFVELGFGGPAERGRAGPDAGTGNHRGLHGNAVVSSLPLSDPAVVRLDAGGHWFSPSSPEPRVGGRMAVVAGVELDGREVTVASVHLESDSDATERAAQLDTLLGAVDARSRGGASVVGGDLNTFGAPLAELADRSRTERLRQADPARFSWPVAYEPLFTVAAERGFTWTAANVAAPTTGHGADGRPDHVPIKLDWLLVRGLEARRPTVIAAVGADGCRLSDHDAVAVSVRTTA